MPRDNPSRLTRARLAILSVAGFAIFIMWPAALAHLAGGPRPQPAPAEGGGPSLDAEFIRAVPLTASDVVYNPADQTLYVSVPSSAGDAGNSIVPVNPATGEVGAPVFVGSEPGRMAMSDDGRTLYVFLEGTYGVRRFDTQTRAAGAQFAVGQDSFHGLYRANDLAVAPGNPNLVAVVRYYLGTSPPEAGVAVFDNGVQRTKVGPGHIDGADFLAFSASESKLYGGGYYGGLRTMTIDASGVTVTGMASFSMGSQIKFAGGRVYSSTGQVVDPDANSLLGTFSDLPSGGGAFAPDPASGRAYYVGQQSFGNGQVVLKAYDLNTFVPVGTATLTGVQGNPTRLWRWGANGLAFRTDQNRLYVIQTSLIPSSDPVPTPTPPTPTPTATPTPVPPATFVRQIDLATNDILYNAATQTLYASVPSGAGARGNSVTRINPETGEVGQSTFVGSEPGRLALADDNQTMYVGLNGANAVRRLDVSSQTAGLQFHLGSSASFGGLYLPNDIDVMPGSPGTVAVSRNGSNGGTADTVVYDDGVPRPQASNDGSFFSSPGGEVEFGATASRLYVGSGSVNRYSVAPNGLTAAGTFQTASAGTTQFAGGLLYLSGGGVVDPEAGTIVGRFGINGFGSDNSMAVEPAKGRAYILTRDFSSSAWVLRSYDINTFRPLAAVNIPGVNSSGLPNGPSALVRWGANGLAFRTSNKVFLIQTALVDAAAPVPTPTPTPTATPTPTPTPPAPTFVRKLDLPANDLVIRAQTGTLYASVPSSAGAERGNTVTTIDPQAGTVLTSTFVGSEPGKMAISDDGNTLYVNLEGASVVRRFDTQTGTPGIQFAVGTTRPPDMEVVPGSPDSLAVSRGTTFDNGVAIFDNGVQRPSANSGGAYGIGPIEFGASASTLYGFNIYDSGADFVKFVVNSSGVTKADSVRGFFVGQSMEFAGARIYGSSGRVYDPETKNLLGTFNLSGSLVAVDEANSRVFFVSDNFSSNNLTLTAFDLNTFLPVGSVTLPNVTGRPAALLRWGVNGLALCTVRNTFDSPSVTSAVYLLQTTLVSAAAPVPSGLQLGAAAYARSESGGSGNNSVAITVTRTGGVSGTSTVSYATSDGTATSGSDYTATSGTLTFAGGETTKTFAVPLLDDNVFEGSETFNVTLSSPTGASLVSPVAAVVTINDNEFRPFISPVPALAVEGNSGTTTAELTVRLSNATTQTATVNYVTANGTAVAGADYTAASGTLTFQPGEIEKKIALQIIGDAAEEDGETFFVDFTNAVNADASSPRGLVSIIDNDRRTVQFSADLFRASEGDGRATLTVTRFGDASTTGRVDYVTQDDSRSVPCSAIDSQQAAFARCDYVTTLDTLTFAPGEREKTFTIPLVDDGWGEIDEHFRVQLTGFDGVLAGTPTTVIVRIADNDGPGAQNPLDAHAFFVRQQYLDFLAREPDANGFNAWVNVLANCPNAFNSDPNSASAGCDRNLVSSAFFRSREFELKGYFVYRFYRAVFGRRPLYPEFTYDSRRVTGQTEAEVYAKRRAYADAWVLRPEFANAYGSLTNNAQFVNSLLGRYGLDAVNAPDPAAPDGDAYVLLTRAELTSALDAQPQRLTRAQVVRAFVESREVNAVEFNGAFVAMQYYGYLRRAPETSGYNNWLTYLNAHPTDFRTMVDGFMNSVEYRLRFGPQ